MPQMADNSTGSASKLNTIGATTNPRTAVMRDHFFQLFHYDAWATRQLLSLADQHQFKQPRIIELLSHIQSTQRIWLERCQGLPESVSRFQDRSLAEISALTEQNHTDWLSYLGSLPARDFARIIHYRNSQGEPFDNRLEDIITHVINHSTHHRGSTVMLLGEEQIPPPALDFILFCRHNNR